jgi:hypothetical protein
VLLRLATGIEQEDLRMAQALTAAVLDEIVALVPDGWLADRGASAGPRELRAAYTRYLLDRLASPRRFVEEALRAR